MGRAQARASRVAPAVRHEALGSRLTGLLDLRLRRTAISARWAAGREATNAKGTTRARMRAWESGPPEGAMRRCYGARGRQWAGAGAPAGSSWAGLGANTTTALAGSSARSPTTSVQPAARPPCSSTLKHPQFCRSMPCAVAMPTAHRKTTSRVPATAAASRRQMPLTSSAPPAARSRKDDGQQVGGQEAQGGVGPDHLVPIHDGGELPRLQDLVPAGVEEDGADRPPPAASGPSDGAATSRLLALPAWDSPRPPGRRHRFVQDDRVHAALTSACGSRCALASQP